MRIIFAFLFGLSFYIAFEESPEKPKGILETVLKDMPEGRISPLKIPVKYVSEFSLDKFGQMIEVRKGYSENDELLEELSYKNDKRYGPHKWYTDGKLSKSSWYYDEKGRRAISISYDLSGKVTDAKCSSRMFFTEEHERVCGYTKPFSYSKAYLNGRLDIILDKGIEVVRKTYSAKGRIWIDEKFAEGKRFEDVYYENGKLRSEYVSEKNGWTEKTYNGEGILVEKNIGIRDQGPYRQEAIIYDSTGAEVAMWEIRKKGFTVQSCTLKRSVASVAPRPSTCP